MSVGSKLQRLSFLLLPAPQKNRSRRDELKKINKRLQNHKPLLYAPVFDQLKPDFALSVHELYSCTTALREVLVATVLHPEQKTREGVQKRFLNRVLQMKGLSLKSFLFDNIRREVTKISGKGIRDMDLVFRSRMSALTDPRLIGIIKGYEQIFRLGSLCTFDYGSLLQCFDPHSDPKSRKIHYRSYPGSKALNHLRDLYFVSAACHPNATGLKLYRLFSTFAGAPILDDNKLIAPFVKIQELLETVLSADTIEDIIRSAAMDPLLELETEQVTLDFVEEIQSSLVKRFTRERNVYAKQTAEKQLRSLISGLFGEEALPGLEGYAAEISNRLKEAGFPAFRHIAALRLLKGFAQQFYIPQIKESFFSILDKGRIVNQEFLENLKAGFEAANDVLMHIEKLEEDLSDSKYSDLPVLLKTLPDLDKEERRKALKTVEDANRRADYIVQVGTDGLNTLRRCSQDLLEDAKQRDSRILENARFLRENERDLLRNLEQSVEILGRFSDIMRHFAVNLSTVKSQMEQLKKGDEQTSV